MSKIQVMSDALASQVAAGEVVERPASVLKELIENSIDAGARTITIDIRRGGIALLRVTDDGSGMSREDALLSIQRHATSKIRSITDLLEITQMGFRGEALPSIAGVSRFRLATREKDAVEGTELLVEGGETKEVRSSGVAQGTTIEIKDLFYNIPARRKFLKSEETEAAQAEHQIRLHALAFPEIRFILRRDDRAIYDIAPSKDWRLRIAQFGGTEMAEKLIPIPETLGPGITVSGYLLPISEARRTRKQQFVFLNRRPIEDPLIARAVRDGYSGFPTGLHPALYLNIEIEPTFVDVNVHPAKREVRFIRPNDVVTTIMKAISEAFAAEVKGKNSPVVSPRRESTGQPALGPPPGTGKPVEPQPAPSQINKPATETIRPAPRPVPPKLAHATELPLPRPETSRPQSAVPTVKITTEPHAISGTKPVVCKREEKASLPFRLLGQLSNGLFLWEGPEGLVIMNPHAARERILFEKFRTAQEGAGIATQQLLVPLVLELDVRDYDVLNQLSVLFDDAGFRLRPFGRDTMQVESVPAFLEASEARAFLMDLVDRLSDNAFARRAKALTFEAFAAELSTRMAKREKYSTGDAERLLNELLSCDLPYCTPANRPTLFPISFQELNRKFNMN